MFGTKSIIMFCSFICLFVCLFVCLFLCFYRGKGGSREVKQSVKFHNFITYKSSTRDYISFNRYGSVIICKQNPSLLL